MASDDTEVDPALAGGDRRQKKRWSDLSSRQRALLVVGATVELILTSIALRDLARRPRRDVRGWKPVWALVSFVQPIGPVLYLVVGRRRQAGG